MGDRGRQIVSEWFNKCANVILQSRVAGTDADDHAPNERQNRWVRRRPFRRLGARHNIHWLRSFILFVASPAACPSKRGASCSSSDATTRGPAAPDGGVGGARGLVG